TDTNHPKQPTEIHDPFGRIAYLHYNERDWGQLDSITDIGGLTSTFSWVGNDFIESMTTPYGTTAFAYGDSTTDPTRWLEVTDPLGNKERTEFRQGATLGIPFSETPAPPASEMPTANQYLYDRNSFFWDKAAYPLARY